ncbi:MAG: hypothetical protein RLZZ517_529 [Candidatus Parcubacteria bacterium]|jgi:hypothetical protein
MIITKLKGGLGNQLFQYAFGRYLAEKNNDTLKLDILGLQQNSKDTLRFYLLDKFNITAEIANQDEIQKIKNPFGFLSKIARLINTKILRNFYIGFEEKLLKLKGNIYLDGYFQSELYFKEIEPIIRNEFTLKNPLSQLAQKIEEQIHNEGASVSIHIRRGDYVTDPSAAKAHGTCDLDYYAQAISEISSSIVNPTFFIFSDDIEWVKENLKVESTTYVSNPNLTEYEELILMSKCKHNIIANSTFSWWAAWLNSNPSKIVIAPKQWRKDIDSDKLQILPKTWIQI